jgi:hypothetical protein
MAETTSDQEQQMKSQHASEAAGPQPAVEGPLPEWEGLAPALSLGLGLGSPDGFEQRAADARQRQNANRQQRVQTLTAMQRQFGNQYVQRFMVQRQSAAAFAPVQRQSGGQATQQTITIDEQGVTNANYNKPGFTTKDEKATPATPPKGVKPEDDLVDVTAKAVVTFKVTVTISLPNVPSGLTACQAKRVKDAIDNKLAPHEKQHEAAMKQYDGVYEETFTLTQIKRSAVTAELTAKAKEIADAQQPMRQKAAQDASDALDQPPFVVNVDLNCEDEKKPGKKQSEEAPAEPGTNEPPPAEGEGATPL